MPTSPPAPARRPGVEYAATAHGYELPVLDVTHPAFTVPDDPASIETLRREFVEQERRYRRMPGLLMRLFMRSATRRSYLVAAFMKPESAVLPGLITYVLKLGSENLLPPFDRPLDRRVAASPAATTVRLRTQQVAQQLAKGLVQELTARPGAPLHLINIGGGPALDSANALILLKRSNPALLDRAITIHVLDPDTVGPQFGERALKALVAPGAALDGLEIGFTHTSYTWDDPAPLRALMESLATASSVIAASSEGALFEYPGDDVVVANLKALYAGGRGARIVAGSVTRGDELTREAMKRSPLKLVPRGAETFGRLIRDTGYAVADVQSTMLSDQVLLRPADELAHERTPGVKS